MVLHSSVRDGALAGRAAAFAVTVLFAVNGALVGGIGGTLPALRTRLGVDVDGVSLLLFCFAGSAVASMQLAGRLADRRGARSVALVSTPLLAGGVLLLAFAESLPVAVTAVLVAGFGNGAMDVAMNALGVQVEQARPRPIMSFFHAFFSVGNLAGAGAVVLLSQLPGLGGARVVLPALLTIGGLSLAWYAAVVRIVPRTAPVPHLRDGVRTGLPPVAWLLGAMAFSIGLTEGTAVDWSSIHVTDVAGIDPGRGALGLVAVAGCMVVIRLYGDRFVAAYGRQRVVRSGAVLAFAGYVLAVTAEPLPLLLVGWALVGLGVGIIFPQVYAAAGHAGGGRMLAVVVTFGYAAFLIGPAITGALVSWWGIQPAMTLPLLLCVVVVALARALPRNDSAAAGRQ
ncbi:MAG: MFS transporter [Micromonosporaceae bacterium]